MLLSFTVKNFRSFKTEETINLMLKTGERIDKELRFENKTQHKNIRVLKNALIYGANGSGKTNLIEALSTLAKMVVAPTMSITDVLPCDTFGHNGKPIEFRIKFLINERIYDYQLAFTKREIVHEHLIFDGKMIFKRNYQVFEYAQLDNYLKDFLNQTVRKNGLFLFAAQFQNLPRSIEVYNWFSQFITKPPSYFCELIAKDETYREKILKGLILAGLNVNSIGVKHEFNEKMVSVANVYLTYITPEETINLNLKSESVGIQQYVHFLFNLFDHTRCKNRVLMLDEFDRSMNKNLAHAIVKLLNSEANTLQFISTTHDSSLMDLLKKHQIYFIEKSNHGQSKIFTLSDFKDVKMTRKDTKFSPKYDEGAYGANQIIDEASLFTLMKNTNK